MACPYSTSCVGMCEWTGCPGAHQLDIAKPHPSLKLVGAPPLLLPSTSSPTLEATPSATAKRFEFASEVQLKELAKGLVPDGTAKTTKWAVKNYEEWRSARNASYPDDPIHDDVLKSNDTDVINTQLSKFIVETRKSNGDFYPPSTLHQLLCGLLRYMRENNPGCPNFLDKKDSRFKQIQGTLDAYFHKLHSEGIGRQVKHAETISTVEEDQLWNSGVLNTRTPKGLQNAVFYTIGKFFCLRGGQEHRSLKLSQLQRDSEKYIYYENVSKNHNGSFKQLHVKNKVVPVYPCPEARERCPVYLLDLYISKLPHEAKEKDLVYVRPLEKQPEGPNEPWYSAVPLGKHTLQQKVKKMCAEAGIAGCKSNHSLRATGATELYKRGVPEKLIQERTGHRSLEALRTYERSSTEQHREASALLAMPPNQNLGQCFTSTKSHTISINPELSTSQSLMPGVPMPVSFQHLHGCVINITSVPQPPAQLPHIDFTETELDQLFSQYTEDLQ